MCGANGHAPTVRPRAALVQRPRGSFAPSLARLPSARPWMRICLEASPVDDDNQRLQVTARVARYLRELDAPRFAVEHDELTGDESISFWHDWAKVFVTCSGRGEWTIVGISIPLRTGLAASRELYRYVATTDSYLFGHLVVREYGAADSVSVSLVHVLLGDYLDREELIMTVESILRA